jgi:hypothetical protein
MTSSMTMMVAAAVAGAALTLAGCGESQSVDSDLRAAALTAPGVRPSTPLLSFAVDGSITQSAPIVSGGLARLHYDIERLPNCRAIYHGLPAWNILASWSVDGGAAHNDALTTVDASGKRVGVDITIAVPPGHDLALWFEASDEFGCVQWDSDYGRNFHVPLAAGAPALHFRWPGWNDDSDGTLTAGADLWIDYDIRRLPWCRQTYNGLQTWDVRADYRFDDGPTQSASVTSISGTERVAAAARVSAPPGARSLELWFVNNDRAGCVAWDSRFGANYRFPLQ